MSFKPMRVLRAALMCAAVSGAATIANADVKDYEFQLAEPSLKIGPSAIITVRLVNKTTGKPVPEAVIFASRLDMTPDSMPQMTTKLTPMRGTEPGTYRFKANVSMADGRGHVRADFRQPKKVRVIPQKCIQPTRAVRNGRTE